MRITEKEYLKALKLVSDYKKQIETETIEIVDTNILNICIKDFLNPLGTGAVEMFICHNRTDPRFEEFKDMNKWNFKRKIYVRHLLTMTENELLSQRQFGKKSLNQIKTFLSANNLSLKIN